jgi:hypothetical protein
VAAGAGGDAAAAGPLDSCVAVVGVATGDAEAGVVAGGSVVIGRVCVMNSPLPSIANSMSCGTP